MIPAQAVEAAARAMAPAAWGPMVWQFAAHGESPTDARDRVQQESLQDARRALEAAAPYIENPAYHAGVSLPIEIFGKTRLASAWGEGYGAGWNDCLLALESGRAKAASNPYEAPDAV